MQEHITKMETTPSQHWEAFILPGQRVETSFLFDSESTESISASCSSCNRLSDGLPDAEILWYVILYRSFKVPSLNIQSKECGIWYRRITEIIDVEPPTPSHKSLPRPHENPAKFGQPSFNAILYGPKLPSRFLALSSSPKRKFDCLELEEVDISHFKRIRFISKRGKLRKATGPFLYNSNTDISILDPTQTQKVDEERA